MYRSTHSTSTTFLGLRNASASASPLIGRLVSSEQAATAWRLVMNFALRRIPLTPVLPCLVRSIVSAAASASATSPSPPKLEDNATPSQPSRPDASSSSTPLHRDSLPSEQNWNADAVNIPQASLPPSLFAPDEAAVILARWGGRARKYLGTCMTKSSSSLLEEHGVSPAVAAHVINTLKGLPQFEPTPTELETDLAEFCRRNTSCTSRKAFYEVARDLIGIRVYGKYALDVSLVSRLLKLAWNKGKEGDSDLRAALRLLEPCPTPATSSLGKEWKIVFLTPAEAWPLYQELVARNVPEAHLSMAHFQYNQLELLSKRNVRSRAGLVSAVLALLHRALSESKEASIQNRAATSLGDHYASGKYVTRDPEKAVNYWKSVVNSAIKKEDGSYQPNGFRAMAAWHLGLILYGRQPKAFGPTPFLPQDKPEGLRLLEMAAQMVGSAGVIAGRAFLFDPTDPDTPRVEDHVRIYGVRPDDMRAAEAYRWGVRWGEAEAKVRLAEMLIYKKATLPPSLPSLLSADVYHRPGIDSERLDTLLHARKLVQQFCTDRDKKWKTFTRDVPENSPIRELRRLIGNVRSNPVGEEEPKMTRDGRGEWSSASYDFTTYQSWPTDT